jgi:hypothetical protein
VPYRDLLCQEIVCDDTTVAAPPYRFGAHDGAAIVTGQRSQFIQSGAEHFSCRVIRIVSEGGDAPEGIERWCQTFFVVPQTAKSW